MSGRRSFASLAVAGSVMACERVVAVDVTDGTKHLVVEARVERVLGRVSGTQTVRLTTTSAYFDAGAPPPASGATVRVSDDNGIVITFNESATSPGVYTTTRLVGVVGRTYTLTIDYAGEHYEASDRLTAVAPIDSVYFIAAQQPDEHEHRPSGGVRGTIDFHDPAGVSNWYLWEEFVDGLRLLGPDSARHTPVSSSDEGLDGRFVTAFQPFGGIAIQPGSHVLIRQLGLSESSYRYFSSIAQQTEHAASPFGVPPANVRGNVSNLSDAARFALGYFMAAEVSESQRTYIP